MHRGLAWQSTIYQRPRPKPDSTVFAAAMLTCDLYSPEQIFITPEWIKVLKDFEKAMLRKGQGVSQHQLLLACKEWWVAADTFHRAVGIDGDWQLKHQTFAMRRNVKWTIAECTAVCGRTFSRAPRRSF